MEIFIFIGIAAVLCGLCIRLMPKKKKGKKHGPSQEHIADDLTAKKAELKRITDEYNQVRAQLSESQKAVAKARSDYDRATAALTQFEADAATTQKQIVEKIAARHNAQYAADWQNFTSTIRAAHQAEVEQIERSAAQEVEAIRQELADLHSTLEEYRAKRDAINQEIMRQRQIEENQDFYRIRLSDEAKHDLELLETIRPQLHLDDSLDKLVYETYIKKPAAEMVKRVLSGDAPCGIYKITRLKTGEIYIGQSVDVSKRWIQHLKTALNAGGTQISGGMLHDVMRKDGVDGFTFELIEKVDRDKLSEREKYYINFYDSKKVGLNMKDGG